MTFWKSIATVVVLCASTMIYGAATAGECDFCVCKGNDTANSCTQCCSAKNTNNPVTELELQISSDGTSIVDQNGQEIARFVEGIRMQTAKSKGLTQKLQGCMRCWNECLIYEGERCVKWVRTCEWDFNCQSTSAAKSSNAAVKKRTETPKIIERELTPDTGEYMKTPCYKTERYCTEWLSDGKCKLWDSRQVEVPC